MAACCSAEMVGAGGAVVSAWVAARSSSSNSSKAFLPAGTPSRAFFSSRNAAFSRAPCAAPATPPNRTEPAAPAIPASTTRWNSLLPHTSELSATNRSAAILIASCAPSVKPSVPTPIPMLRREDLMMLGSAPDLSSTFSITFCLTGPVNLFNKYAGNAESSAADTEP